MTVRVAADSGVEVSVASGVNVCVYISVLVAVLVGTAVDVGTHATTTAVMNKTVKMLMIFIIHPFLQGIDQLLA